MSETVVSLFMVTIVLLGVLLMISFVILRRLGRIEQRISIIQSAQQEGVKSIGGDADGQPAGGAFEEFLSEDPKRMALPKSEQFAEFRKWRKQKGMNWSGS